MASVDNVKLQQYIANARMMGIAVLPPDINSSGLTFTPIPGEKAIRFGLGAIKNVGEKAAKEIITERKNGKFNEFFDTVERISSSIVNFRSVQALIESGAFDTIKGGRESFLASLPNALTIAKAHSVDQARIEAGGRAVNRKKALPSTTLIEAAKDRIEMLKREHDAISYYLSDHPYNEYSAIADNMRTHSIQEAFDLDDGKVTLAGVISGLREHTTKKGNQKMYFGTLEDDLAALDFVIFPKQTKRLSCELVANMAVILTGNIDRDSEDSQPKLFVETVEPIYKAKTKKTNDLHIILDPKNYRSQIKDAIKKRRKEEWISVAFEFPDGRVIRILPGV